MDNNSKAGSGGGFFAVMMHVFAALSQFTTFILSVLLLNWSNAYAVGNESFRIPILVYHRFVSSVGGRTAMTVSVFDSQLRYLKENDYTVIPLGQLVQHRLSGIPALPIRAVVITADDGHRSVYTQMLPLIRQYRVPMTLFVYPSAVSNAAYALTWEQLFELRETRLVDIQSHTYWHPNFNQEKRWLSRDDYEKLVQMQLKKSKETLEKKLRTDVDLLAWPFGIFDTELITRATEAGYKAGFTIAGRHATAADSIMAIPRYLMTPAYQEKAFAELLAGKLERPRRDD